MPKQKIIKSVFTLFVSAVLLCACGATPPPSRPAPSSSLAQLPTEVTKWLVEPSVEMGDIRPVVSHEDISRINDEEHRLKSQQDYYKNVMIAEKDEAQGLIDYAGNIVLPLSYEVVEFGKYRECDFDGTTKTDLSEHEPAFSEKVILAFDGTQFYYENRLFNLLGDDYQPSSSLVFNDYDWKFLPFSDYFWDISIKHVTHYAAPTLGGPEWFDNITDETVPVPVRFVTREYDEQIYDYILYDNQYGYAIGGSLLLEAQYVYAQHVWEGIAAVSDGDNWYYITMDGQKISEIAYDVAAVGKKNSGTRLSGFPFVYDFSEGLVAVCRDGLWGYMNKIGVEVIPCQYEATRPVYDGKAWIKTGGLWGVADLSDYIS